MSLPFSLVCQLLETLHEQCVAGRHRQTCETVQRWFQHHRQLIHALDSRHGAALLSMLLPARRTDRVYCIQTSRLEKIFARAQRLGTSRVRELYRYKEPGSGVDLADCIFTILKATPNPVQHVTVLEIDTLLHAVASAVPFSAPAIRAAEATLSASHRNGLESMYLRLTPLEAKWFTRLVLKDYRPIKLDETVVLQSYHPILPCIMKVLDHFCPALAVLDRASQPGGMGLSYDRRTILRHLKPVLGTKVGSPPWRKARSIKHCLDMSHGRMSVEKKIDGEHCQVHVDLSKSSRCIQIFSKSGRDSTDDRSQLHGPRSYEHLMIIYYDVLLIDDESLLGVRHSERFERLKHLVVTRPGHAELVDRHIIDVGRPQAASDLRNMFARAILAREEGLVLKPDEPFIYLDKTGAFCGSPIKFKKEYIGKFGDVGDFAVVGARYDPDKAKCYRIPGLKWTHFYLGCLARKSDLYTAGAVPQFILVAVVDLNETMLKTVVSHCQPLPVPARDNQAFDLTIPPGLAQGKRPSVIFTQPLVFDVRCFSFDKEGNVGFYTPRFPTVSKVHFDRDYRDTITFPELQELAARATTEKPWEDRDSQEFLEWLERLEKADPRGAPVDRVTQETASTVPTPSPKAARKVEKLPSIAESASSGESPSEPPRSPGVTLTPPTSLPRPPSSHSGEDRQGGTPHSKKRNCDMRNDERICRRSPTSLSEKPPSPEAGGNSSPDTRRSKRHKFRVEDQEQIPSSPSRNVRARSAVTQAKGPARHRAEREPLAEVVNPSSQRANPYTRSTASRPGREPDGAQSQPSSQLPLKTAPSAAIRSTTFRTADTVTPQHQPSLCPLKGTKCPFHNRPILLSPSLAARKDITETLLPQHGIHAFITDRAAWRPEDVDRPDTWKICLVDAEKTSETLEFLNAMEKRPLKRRDGREYVEVYDWRVLVWVAEAEKGEKKRARGGAFGRWFVGLV
ncbi:hypothetical protein VUR80DRAFT_1363 [Thermomyces stellatus]